MWFEDECEKKELSKLTEANEVWKSFHLKFFPRIINFHEFNDFRFYLTNKSHLPLSTGSGWMRQCMIGHVCAKVSIFSHHSFHCIFFWVVSRSSFIASKTSSFIYLRFIQPTCSRWLWFLFFCWFRFFFFCFFTLTYTMHLFL